MPLQDAAIRAEIDGELLSRPPLDLPCPATVHHQAFLAPAHGGETSLIKAVCAARGVAAPAPGTRQIIHRLDAGALKWERHGEFETLTIVEHAPEDAPFFDTEIKPVLESQDLPQRIAACRIALHPMRDMQHTGGSPRASAAALLIGGEAMAFAHYPPGEDGYTHMSVYLNPIPKGRAGRLIQRLLEIETYRYMALLSFPLARRTQTALSQLNTTLDGHIAALSGDSDHAANEALLDDIQALLQETAVIRAGTGFRFAATRAYQAIVEKRLLEIREERLEGFSRLSTFLARRMHPALDLCAATERQQNALDERLNQSAQILRTRVEMGLAHQNQKLLARLEASSAVQIKLQRSVEGFSVVAISYYLVSLIAIFLKGGEKAGWFAGWEIYEAILAPIAILGVVLRLRHVLKTHADTA